MYHIYYIIPPNTLYVIPRALFIDEVTYHKSRHLKDKRRRGIVIINGVELAVLNIQPGAGGGQAAEGDAAVIAHYSLNKVTPRANGGGSEKRVKQRS